MVEYLLTVIIVISFANCLVSYRSLYFLKKHSLPIYSPYEINDKQVHKSSKICQNNRTQIHTFSDSELWDREQKLKKTILL